MNTSNAAVSRTSGARLGRNDWIDAAMDLLARVGVEGVRVEKLAKDLKVTKGSFYWHFKDRDELLEAILEKWRRQETLDILEYLGSLEDPYVRLQKLARMPLAVDLGRDPVALSLRLWARHDDRALKTLAEVDKLRVRMKSQLFQACGLPPAEADARAILLYSYMRVARTLVEDDKELFARCEQLLVPARDDPGGAS